MAKKKLENMTFEERMEYYDKRNAKEAAERQKIVDQIPADMMRLIADLATKAERVSDTGGYGCNGGVRYLSAFDLQELESAVQDVRHKFNLSEFSG